MHKAALSTTVEREANRVANVLSEWNVDSTPATAPAERLMWLVGQFCQFAGMCTHFIRLASETTEPFSGTRAWRELHHMVIDDESQGAMRNALLDLDMALWDFDFQPTVKFIRRMEELMTSTPSGALGAASTLEGTAVADLNLIQHMCREIAAQHHTGLAGTALSRYFTHNLEGARRARIEALVASVNDVGDIVDVHELQAGSTAVADAMCAWWRELFHALAAERRIDLVSSMAQ